MVNRTLLMKTEMIREGQRETDKGGEEFSLSPRRGVWVSICRYQEQPVVQSLEAKSALEIKDENLNLFITMC